MVNLDDDDDYEEENYVFVVDDDEKSNLMPRSMPRVCSALPLLISIRKTVSA